MSNNTGWILVVVVVILVAVALVRHNEHQKNPGYQMGKVVESTGKSIEDASDKVQRNLNQ